jgi:hypothetical protein
MGPVDSGHRDFPAFIFLPRPQVTDCIWMRLCHSTRSWVELPAPGRRERLPAHAPLRTVRESFPSHGSSLVKKHLWCEMFHCSIKSVQLTLHPNFYVQLGNTRMWPFTLRSIGRQLRDALSDWRRSSFAFPG